MKLSAGFFFLLLSLSSTLQANSGDTGEVIPWIQRKGYFLHFHKAGGTTLCYNARFLAQLTSPRRNCNMPGDGPRTLRKGLSGFGNVNLTCEARHKYTEDHCIEFFASERWLDSTLCQQQFIYITMLRDPIRRIESNCRFEKVPVRLALRWLRVSHFPDERVFLGTASVDNFYIRSLGGYEIFHTPAGEVDRSMLDYAMRRLDSFELILILEDLDEMSADVLLAKLLGWKFPRERKGKPGSGLQPFSWGKGDESIRFSESDLSILRAQNQLDLELYSYARSRAPLLKDRILAESHPAHELQLDHSKPSCKKAFDRWDEQVTRKPATRGSRRQG